MRKFLNDRRGNVAMTFALSLTPLIVLSGGAVDFSHSFAERQRAQDALDRATLAGGKDIGLVDNSVITASITALYKDFYKPPAGSSTTDVNVTVDSASGKVTAKVNVKTQAHFLPMVNIPYIESNLTSQVALGNSDFDVVMVLDTSGSMGGSKITTLKSAAQNMANTLFNMNTTGGRATRVQVGIVPFSGSVNVGPGFGPTYSGTTRLTNGSGSAWLDVNTLSPIHNENWGAGLSANRFDLFAKLAAAYPAYASKLSWAGCVEMRAYPYSVSDAAPSSATPATLYVPSFAPDEAGYATSGYTGYVSDTNNSYLSDKAGTCSSVVDYSTTAGKLEGQGRICKYNAPATSAFLNASSLGGTWGPNQYCRSEPIQPLTLTPSQISSKITALSAAGNTNILEGVAWGMRVLSPGAPFTEGRTATASQPLQKIMIVMTDGENTYGTDTSVYNKSDYGPYGYLTKDRLGIGTISSSNVLAKQNTLTNEACSNAKNAGVLIYSIAFMISDTTAKNVVMNCATSPDYYYDAGSTSDLTAAFQSIANQISRLRIAS